LKVLIPPGKSGNVLATIAIGEQYLQPFMKYAYHTWEMYCRRHDLGLILFDDDLISPDHPKWKKATWQKYLIGDVVSKSDLAVNNICYLDTDILISPLAPNIFDQHREDKITLVSQWFDLPHEREEVLRRIAFLRNRFFSSEYPLDSLLFASLDQLFAYSSLPAQPNYACAGLFIFNAEKFKGSMSEFFLQYDSSIFTPSSGGDELYFNFFAQSNGFDHWIDYQYQALWIYEISMNYPFLYESGDADLALMKKCIEASLFSNYFLHFAGSWHESKMWEQVKVFDTPESLDMFRAFGEYMKTPVYGKPLGAIKPKENS
jgi:hypothetical protein